MNPTPRTYTPATLKLLNSIERHLVDEKSSDISTSKAYRRIIVLSKRANTAAISPTRYKILIYDTILDVLHYRDIITKTQKLLVA